MLTQFALLVAVRQRAIPPSEGTGRIPVLRIDASGSGRLPGAWKALPFGSSIIVINTTVLRSATTTRMPPTLRRIWPTGYHDVLRRLLQAVAWPQYEAVNLDGAGGRK